MSPTLQNKSANKAKTSQIGLLIREHRRKKSLKQSDVAAKCDCTPGYIGQLEIGKRKFNPRLLQKIGGALELEAAEIDDLLSLLEPQPDSSNPILHVRTWLEKARDQLSASSIVFYVRDPFWPDDFRLIAMPGVQLREPMNGFYNPGTTNLTEEEDFPPDIRKSAWRDQSVKLPGLLSPDYWQLFGDFIEREGVKTSARLLLKRDGAIDGILFVNFSDVEIISDEVRSKIRLLRDSLVKEIPAITQSLQLEEAEVQQAIALLRSVQAWVLNIGRQPQTLRQFLESVIKDVMDIVGISRHNGIGTIHLYRPEDETLVLAAHIGNVDVERTAAQSVSRGEGVISWVAVRRRALLIEDLLSSPFGKAPIGKDPIYLPISFSDHMRSLLAVPMKFGNELMGVLNLESLEPSHFKSNHVRPVWFAARSAGIVSRLTQQMTASAKIAEMSADIVDWFCRRVATREPQNKADSSLAKIACASLDAKECDIWRYTPSGDFQFSLLAATRDLLDLGRPRDRGWSEYVRRTRTSVWIGNLTSSPNFDVSYWNSTFGVWESNPPRAEVPTETHQGLATVSFNCELGIPILEGAECVGVAWIKFDIAANRFRPTREEMRRAEKLADIVGRVLSSLSLGQPQQLSPSLSSIGTVRELSVADVQESSESES